MRLLKTLYNKDKQMNKMKISIQILSALLIINMAACKSKKAITTDQTNKENVVVIPVLYTEMPCGGAAPPPEVMEEMERAKPMANTVVYIAKMREETTQSLKVKTDKAGMITASLDTGHYQLFLFDPVPLSQQKDSMTEKEDCEKFWKLQQSFPLMIKKGQPIPEVMIMKMCNPCEEPKP